MEDRPHSHGPPGSPQEQPPAIHDRETTAAATVASPWGFYRRILVRLLLAVIGTIALYVAVVLLRHEAENKTVADLVGTYLDARSDRNAPRACAQLSEGQQREVVARVSRVPMSEASPAQCERHILQVSPASRFTGEQLRFYDGREIDAEVRTIRGSGMQVGVVTPKGLPEPQIFAWKRDGEWKLDGEAMLGASMVAGCSASGQPRPFCACLFDELRARNPGHPTELEHRVEAEVQRIRTGAASPVLTASAQACAPTAGS
jgi:hypothetical protein